MKKTFWGLLIAVVLLLGVIPLQAATPVAELAGLAQYYPANTPIIAMLQTDDGFIGELDGALAKIIAKLPPGIVPPGVSLRALLDQGAAQISGQGFADGVRPWLGDSAAFGVTTPESLSESQPQFLLALSITDRAAAEAFANTLLTQSGEAGNYQTTTVNGFTVLAPTGDTTGVIAIGDDVAFVGLSLADVPVEGLPGGSLAENPAFQAALDLLPEDAYNALIYADTIAITEASRTSDAKALAQIAAQEAVGFTLLDGSSLVMDVAISTGDLSALEQLGLNLGSGTPVDPAFAAYIPADASLVVHTSNLANAYQMLLTLVRANESTPGQFDQGFNQLKSALRELAGLDLEQDVFGWMTGDFAVFTSFDTAEFLEILVMQKSVELSELPLDFGLVVEATDPAKAKALANGIAQALPFLARRGENLTVTSEQIGGVDVSVVSVAFPDSTPAIPPLHVVIGANDKVFVVATRAAAKAILSGTGGLDTAPGFAQASRYLLDDAMSVWYMDTNGFGAAVSAGGLTMLGPSIEGVFDNIVSELNNQSVPTLSPEEIERREQERLQEQRQMIDMMLQVASILSTSSISTTTSGDGDLLARFVITLAD